MNWTLVKWLALGLLVASSLGFGVVMRYQALVARAQRDTALIEKETAVTNLETERLSTRAALDAAARATNETAETLNRCSIALDGMRADADRYRVALRSCRTPDAVADRMGALFP